MEKLVKLASLITAGLLMLPLTGLAEKEVPINCTSNPVCHILHDTQLNNNKERHLTVTVFWGNYWGKPDKVQCYLEPKELYKWKGIVKPSKPPLGQHFVMHKENLEIWLAEQGQEIVEGQTCIREVYQTESADFVIDYLIVHNQKYDVMWAEPYQAEVVFN